MKQLTHKNIREGLKVTDSLSVFVITKDRNGWNLKNCRGEKILTDLKYYTIL